AWPCSRDCSRARRSTKAAPSNGRNSERNRSGSNHGPEPKGAKNGRNCSSALSVRFWVWLRFVIIYLTTTQGNGILPIEAAHEPDRRHQKVRDSGSLQRFR